MEPTTSTSSLTREQPGATEPTTARSHRGISLAATAAVVAASLGAAAVAPVVGFVTFNHNETLVVSRKPRARRVRAAGVVAATVAAVSVGAVAVATPVLAQVSLNHN
jgi:hypothetical protein